MPQQCPNFPTLLKCLDYIPVSLNYSHASTMPQFSVYFSHTSTIPPIFRYYSFAWTTPLFPHNTHRPTPVSPYYKQALRNRHFPMLLTYLDIRISLCCCINSHCEPIIGPTTNFHLRMFTGMPLNGHKKVGNYICLQFCSLSANSQKTYVGSKENMPRTSKRRKRLE